MADQLDDWKDYLRLKIIDRGKDFAFLREIVSTPITELREAAGGARDGGYFSRRGSMSTNTDGAEARDVRAEDDDDDDDDRYFRSRRGSRFKLSETATPTVIEEPEAENEGDPGYFSRQGSSGTAPSM